MTRQKLVAGNWKMYGSREMTQALVSEVSRATAAATAEVLVCPPYTYLAQALALAEGSRVQVGAQNLCMQTGEAALTGEVSGTMLAELGCNYVLVGHSERRQVYGEDDACVAAKFVAAQQAGLQPILCIGESLQQRQADQTDAVLAGQLLAVMEVAGVAAFAKAVVAYEPVWAIGTGQTATPEQAQSAHACIRAQIAQKDVTISGSLRVLYGGSVKPDNAASLFACPDIDGGLIGGASLKAADFLAIIQAAS